MPPRFRSRFAATFSLLALLAGCEEVPETRVDRDTFIQAYVDIRTAALEAEEAQPTEAQREAILARYGVSADDLVDFVRAHGEDVVFMRALWDDIEVRLEADSLSGGEEGLQ